MPAPLLGKMARSAGGAARQHHLSCKRLTPFREAFRRMIDTLLRDARVDGQIPMQSALS
jgi:hypothetical protein